MRRFSQVGEDTMVRDRLISGDEETYAWLYKKYVRMLFSYGMRFTRNSELIKDCIHDVFVKLYGKRSSLAEVSQVKSYLLICLRNELCTALKKDRNSIEQDNFKNEPIFSVDYTAEESIIAGECSNEQQWKIRRALSMLTPRQKEVFYYRYMLEMSLTEICEVMGINYQSLQNLMQRSFQKVRERIDNGKEDKRKDVTTY